MGYILYAILNTYVELHVQQAFISIVLSGFLYLIRYLYQINGVLEQHIDVSYYHYYATDDH